MKYILPLPPSINQTYGIGGFGKTVMYKRKPVKDWETTAGWEIKHQYMKLKKTKLEVYPLSGDVQMEIHWFYRINRDIDAGLKVLLDLFQKQNIYLNDRQVRKITNMTIERDSKNPRVEVELCEIKKEVDTHNES